MRKSAAGATPSAGRNVGAPALAVDDAQRVLDDGALGAQVLGREHHLAAGRHDVLDDHEQALPPDVAALADRSVPYFFGSLRTKKTGSPVTDESIVARGTPPSSSPARPSVPAGTQGHEGLDDLFEQHGVRLEAVLVEVVVGRATRAQDEGAREVGCGEDSGGQRHDPIVPAAREELRGPVLVALTPPRPRRCARARAGSAGAPGTASCRPGPSSH